MGRLAILAICALAAPGIAAAKSCLVNAGDAPLFLTVETAEDRRTGWRDPGAWLCAAGGGNRITVAAFEGEDVLEGCSRRVPGDGVVEIRAYQGVDLCLWSE